MKCSVYRIRERRIFNGKRHPSEVHSTFDQRERSKSTAKIPRKRKTLHATLLTGAHLEHEIEEVRKASLPNMEHAGDTSVRAQASIELLAP